MILLDIMEGISQGVSARERRVNSRPLAHDMPFARATYLPLLDKNANKTKEEDALLAGYENAMKKFIGMMAQECTIKHCLELLPFRWFVV